MRATDLEGLLEYGDSDWLDFKAELHFGIKQPGADRAARQEGQGALLKDLMCLANSPSPGRTRFLVRGVKDLKSVRQVTGVSTHLDADVQGLRDVLNALRPKLVRHLAAVEHLDVQD